jgi:hypothetical protein
LPFIKEERCALFIGAGLSRIAGCYDWDSIVKEMLDHPLVKSKGIEKNELMGRMRNDELIGYCQQLFLESNEEHKFWGIARRAIMFNPALFDKEYLPMIRTLKQIDPTPKVILTTNIDDCLEYTNEFDLSTTYFKVEDFTEHTLNGPGIFHIHGYKEEFEKSLLTRGKYVPRYRNKAFQEFIKRFFKKYSVLFLGYSLRDQEVKDIIFQTKDEHRMHYLLIPEEDGFTSSEMSFYQDVYGMVSVVYGPRNNFRKILAEWVDRNFRVTSLKQPEVEKPDA